MNGIRIGDNFVYRNELLEFKWDNHNLHYMPGFIATINTKIKIAPSNETSCLIEAKSSRNYSIERRTSRKFVNDKFFYENENYIFLLDGVVLNNHLLVEKYKAVNWKECVEEMHSINPTTFYNEFRGSFLGLVYNKKKDEWLFYTDHIGDKQIFYAHLSDGGWLIGTEMSYMVDTMRLNNQILTPNQDAAYMDITLGYVIENQTLVNEIQKVVAGHYISISKDGLNETEYHRFCNNPTDGTEEEIINELDRRFRNAVKSQFEKDKEYGYKHVACLSGGLDSRMTVWVAHNMGYTKQLNLTFCQSNYVDFQVAQKIATDLKHDFIFKALDAGNCIYDIDKVSTISYGLACFFGLSHTYSMFSKLNLNDYGIIHSGMLGDVIIGSFLKEPQYGIPATISDGAYSIEIIDSLKDYKFRYNYQDSEIYMMYNRGFGFCGQGTLAYCHEQTENLSPFCDVDFMEYCLSIPLNLRCNHKVYLDWILSKYPEAGDYVWEKRGATPREIIAQRNAKPIVRHLMTIGGMSIPTPRDPYFGEYIKGFILRRLGLRKKVGKQKQHVQDNEHTVMLSSNEYMNPVDYWYYNNPDLKQFMDSYWTENKYVITDKQLLSDMTYLYEECEATYDKLQPLTVIAAYKLIFEK